MVKYALFSVAFLIFARGLIAGAEPGFFRVEKRDGRWWLIAPDGHPSLSKGVCHVRFEGDRIQGTSRSPYQEAVSAKYGGIDAWRASTARRLLEWGFNSLGAWSDDRLSEIEINGRRLACAPILDLGARYVATERPGAQAWLHGVFPDVFDPKFESFCRKRAFELCAPQKENRTILGWFTDNELRWGPDWRGKEELLTLFLNMPRDSAGHRTAVQFLSRRYQNIAQFNKVWKTAFSSWEELANTTNLVQPFVRQPPYARDDNAEKAANSADPNRAAFASDCDEFAGVVADRYFVLTRAALREADPNHLNFGCRFAYLPPLPVRTAAARHLDVISFNCYLVDPTPVVRQYAALGRPLLIGEFTFRGEDTGLPNTRGAGPKVPNQEARAAAFKRYVRLVVHDPAIIGYHWFQHSDQPKEGRFDGENSNYGLVNENDEPYVHLTETMKTVNALADVWHEDSACLVFHDALTTKLADGWRWIRKDDTGWRITVSGLELRVFPGSLWGSANNARNVLLRPIPEIPAHEVRISVTVQNQPTQQYEQVNLAWYYDDANMVKLGHELVDGKLCVVMGREEKDNPSTIGVVQVGASTVQLQLVARDRVIKGRFRSSDADEWTTIGQCDLAALSSSQGRPFASIHCYHGPADAERWARITDFRIEAVGNVQQTE